MVRLLILLLGMLTTSRASGRQTGPGRHADASYRSGDTLYRPGDDSYLNDDTLVYLTDDTYRDEPDAPHAENGSGRRRDWPVPPVSPPPRYTRGRRRRLIPLWVKGTAVVALIALIFRKAIAFVVLTALSATLHLIGINVHLPNIKFAWPWQSITAGTTTDIDVGPWVLQKIEGISNPALGTENFNFLFTHKVTKNIGPWPCWYASTFYAVGHASATVDLNPGPAWWAPASGHYRLQVLGRPVPGKPGSVMVTITLPQPQLPQSVHDITIDNTLSQPIDTQHSWTYPGFGCGALIQPQFPISVLYSQAQSIAFSRATHDPQVTRPLISAAEAEATQIIRDNFIQPTVNALGYTLTRFTLEWSAAS